MSFGVTAATSFSACCWSWQTGAFKVHRPGLGVVFRAVSFGLTLDPV